MLRCVVGPNQKPLHRVLTSRRSTAATPPRVAPARRCAHKALSQLLGAKAVMDDAVLVVSDLVTNAVRAGRGGERAAAFVVFPLGRSAPANQPGDRSRHADTAGPRPGSPR